MDEKQITVSVISPEKVIFEGKVTSVNLPGTNGSFEILADHVSIVSVLLPGTISLKTAEGKKEFIIGGGFVEASKNNVNALIESIVSTDNIDPEAEKAAIDNLLSGIITQEKRSKTENALNTHRLRINLSAKKQ